jgi:hypothetical protein
MRATNNVENATGNTTGTREPELSMIWNVATQSTTITAAETEIVTHRAN